MNLIRFVLSILFLKQLAIVAVLGVGTLIGLHYWMGYLTEQDFVVEVPDLRGLTTSELVSFMDTVPLPYLIIDSIYSDEVPKGTVADQDPLPGTGAKRGRKVYLTVNALLPQQVKMPDLRNLSIRQARAILETVGLKLGDISFRPDIARNAVLDQEIGSSTVRPGALIFKGTRVNLVLGDGLSDIEMPMPYLMYQQIDSALAMLRMLSLNLGALVIDTPITDSSLLRVYRQIPAFNPKETIRGGNSIDLFVTQDTISINFDRELYLNAWRKEEEQTDFSDFETEEEEF
jgi:eukaryotic-like serine/threonine-protein kinase